MDRLSLEEKWKGGLEWKNGEYLKKLLAHTAEILRRPSLSKVAWTKHCLLCL